MSLDDVVKFLDNIVSDTTTKIDLLDSLIDKVILCDDKCVVSFYYTDAKAEYSIDEMLKSLIDEDTDFFL